MKQLNNKAIPLELITGLKMIILRLECGWGQQSVLRNLPKFKSTISLTAEWLELKKFLHKNSLPWKESLEAWLQKIQLQRKVLKEIEKHILLPKIQAQILSLGAVAIIVFSSYIFPQKMPLDYRVKLISLTLIVCAFLSFSYMIHKIIKELWLLDWAQMLFELSNHLRVGQSFAFSLVQLLNKEDLDHWPKSFKKELITKAQDLKDAKKLTRSFLPEKLNAVEQIAWQQWHSIAQLSQESAPLANTLESYANFSLESFLEHINEKAQKTTLKALGLLFVFLMPALLLVLFWPIITFLKKEL